MKRLFDASRPTGRLLYFLISLWIAVLLTRTHAQTVPATTTVQDVIYHADGSPAAGTLIIAWTAFTTADGHAIAAGSRSIVVGSNGVVSIALVPTEGSDPPSYYKITIKLDTGETDEEIWTIPAAGPSAISLTDALASKDVIDANQFNDGMSKIIDGVVACLNASVWAKK
jgi:hypothetical protein